MGITTGSGPKRPKFAKKVIMMNNIYCASNWKHFKHANQWKARGWSGPPGLLSRLNRRWLPRGQNVYRLCYLPPANLLKQRGRSSCVHSSPALLARTAEFTGPKNRHTWLKLKPTWEMMLWPREWNEWGQCRISSGVACKLNIQYVTLTLCVELVKCMHAIPADSRTSGHEFRIPNL